MKRAALLTILAFCCLALKDDQGTVRIKAFVCEKSGVDYCGKRHRAGIEPARVRLEVYLRQHPDNRAVGYGLDCDGEIVAESRGELDGEGDPPLLFVEHRDISSGHCFGLARLARRNGEVFTARDGPLTILPRD